MTVRSKLLAATYICTAVALPTAPLDAQPDPNLQHLEAEIARLAELAGGPVGVAAIHLETGRRVSHNGAERFGMASTYKVPIAVQLFTRVDAGEISLDSMIEVRQVDLHPGSGTLSRLFDDPGVILSLRNLTELMLLISDNSPTDIVLTAAGGGEAVTARMRTLGIEGIDVNRPTVHLIGDWIGVEGLPPSGEVTLDDFSELSDSIPDEVREQAGEAFERDTRDTATPDAMADLLARIWRKEILSEQSSELLLDIMRRSTTGRARIKGLLPPDTEVFHKTGTIGGTTNDVGIVTLPNEAGHVVTVVLIKESDLEGSERELAIAHIARAIHDYFLFNP